MLNLLIKMIENNQLNNIISLITKPIFKTVHKICMKQSRNIIFIEHTNQGFSDNNKHLFLNFFYSYADEFNYYWLTSNKLLIDQIRHTDYGNRIVYQYSMKAFKLLLTSKFLIYSSGMNLPISFSNNSIGIQLWHGIPIKAMGIANKGLNTKVSSRIKKQIDHDFKFWICSSDMDKITTMRCTGLPSERVIITGYPRNDYLIEHRGMPDIKMYDKYPYLRKKIILYAPTWRDDEKVKWFPFDDFSFDELIKFLEINDAYILIRGHQIDDIQRKNCGPIVEETITNRILFANRDIFPDVQELLPHVDVLISDYSGIWVDYLLLDRPIIFIPYDLNKYQKNPGLMYDYDNITPGFKITSFSMLLDALSKYLDNPKLHSDLRLDTQLLFHKYTDGKSYERLMDLIKSEIGES